MRSHLTAVTCALMFAATPMMAQNINLPPNPAFPIGPFGLVSVATVGETFTAPAPTNVLQSFQFYLANNLDNGGNGGNLLFRGYVSEFDMVNDKLTGPLLFQSAITAGTNDTTFAPFRFNAGSLVLDPGKTYVAFLSASGLTPTGGVDGAVNTVAGTDAPNSRGSLVFSNNGNDFGFLSQNDAFGVVEGSNAAFSAQFTVTPEPSEFVLLASGLSGLAGIVRLRRRRVAGA